MTAIQFNNVSKTYGQGLKKQKVLHDLSLSIMTGEVFGFLGPNGAGKSTTIKLLLNFIRPDQGDIHVKQCRVGKDNYLHHIGYLPETPCFYENLTASEIMYFSGKISGLKQDQLKEQTQDILKRLKLDHAQSWQIGTYSKGMKQRLGLALALVHDPEIYILDEPMSGLDPMGRYLITDVILELKQRGKTVFFSSHILSDVEKLCNRIAILNKGKHLFSGAIDEILPQYGSNLEHAFMNIIQTDDRGKNG
ncbi:MAG: ABC transporter ATP-binding protein [Proteobacteria bacterium]|nr:ABC transporter ATP-binding protein [Pseudomonadota bacterium]